MSPSPPCGLRLERLEARATPAVASVRATLAAGVLTLTGDAADDNVVLQVGPAGATLTPGSGTSVNGLPAGTAVVLPGPVRSLRAALGAGNDRLALGGGDLVLPGAARIDLGAGDDTLDLGTGGTIALGALTVVAGDG